MLSVLFVIFQLLNSPKMPFAFGKLQYKYYPCKCSSWLPRVALVADTLADSFLYYQYFVCFLLATLALAEAAARFLILLSK